MSFVNPALLFGALLFAVPLIIHLLNRQRHKRREWAAMSFLLLAYRKQRRRLRTENLLLLLLRCLIPIILALAIARPVLHKGLAAAALGSSAHHVLILDNSYSMGFHPDGAQSPFQRMKDIAGQMLESLSSRNGNKVTIVLAGIRTQIPVAEDLNTEKAMATIASLGIPQDSGNDLTDALGQVADLVERSPDQDVIVYLFSDLQVRAFGEQPEEQEGEPRLQNSEDLFDDTARDLIERIDEDGEVVLIDVGGLAHDNVPARANNVQISNIELRTMVAVARNPVSVAVTVQNLSDAAVSAEVTLEVDGAQPTRRTLNVEAGAEAQEEFAVTFRDVGLRTLRASLDGDGLDADNDRFMVVPVRDQIRVLIVEGSPESDPGLMESEHLRAVLDPTDGDGSSDLTVFAPTVIDTIAFLSRREDLRDYDLVALANVERLNEAAAAAIAEAMLGGTGLLVMLGDRTDCASFNLHLHGLGDGPMPMQLTRPLGFEPGGPQFYESKLLVPDHPVFSGFVQEMYREAFQLTPIYRFLDIEAGTIENGEVLAAVRDADLSPLVVVSSFGTGKALFLTSGVSLTPNRWNRFDLLMLSLPLFHEAARWLTLPQTDPYNVTTGAELTTTLRERPVDVAVLLPERAGGTKVLVGEDSRSLPGGRYSLPPFRQTEFAGLYTAEMQLATGSARHPHREHFAANVDPDEGNLSYLPHSVAREQLGVETVLRGLPSASDGPVQGGSSDLGVPLLYLALFVLLSEACLARFVSRRRAA